MQLVNILSKNIKLLFNSKLSSLILLLGPLLLISIIGAALQDTSIKNIITGVYATDSSAEFKDAFIYKLEEKEFNVVEETSLEECKQKVRDAKIHLCINLKEMKEGIDIDLHVDFSKQRIVWNIIGKVQGIIEEESYNKRQEIILELKTKTTEILGEINIKNEEIGEALDKIDYIEDKTNIIEDNYESLQDDLEDISDNLQAFIEELDYYSQTNPELISLVGAVREMQNQINAIQQKDFSQEINEAQYELKNAEANLKETRNSLKDIEDELEEIQKKDIERAINPIALKYFPVSSDGASGEIKEQLGFLDYLFPSFLVFFILFDSLIFAVILRIQERKSNAYVRNILGKANGATFITSDFLTSILLILFQTAIILTAANFFLNINLISNIIPLSIFIFLIVSIFTLLGLALGSIFNSQEGAIISAISLSLLFFIFSSVITPIETLPTMAANLLKISPITILETKLRLTLIFNAPLRFMLPETISIIGGIIISSIIIFLGYKKNKEKEI